jgi:membrane protein
MLQFKILKKAAAIVSFSTLRRIGAFLRHYIYNLFKRMDEHNLFFAAAGISFSLLLGMIPFILLAFYVLETVFEQGTIEMAIYNLIDQMIPYSSYADYAKKLLSSRLPEVMEYKTVAGYIGVFGLLLTSTWIFSSIRTTLNQIFNVKIQRSFIYGLFRDMLMVLLLVILLSVATFIVPAVNIIYEMTKNYDFVTVYSQSPLWKLSVYTFSFIFLFGMFFLLFYLIPYEQLGKKVAAVSAFWSTVLWEVARYIFGYYINHILGTSAIYGTFVLILALLSWIFYSACLFIVGAEIGQLFRERRGKVKQLKNSSV